MTLISLPVTRLKRLTGANGTNWPGYVQLDPDAPHRAAVWAQEAWEAMHKLNPINLIRVRLSRRARRRMEIMGHEVEVQAAALVYARSLAAYRRAEATAMRDGYDGLFSAVPAAAIVEAMAARGTEAARWVRRNRNAIERWK